ncbi:Fe-S cluster assembly sulfur transfer protein SufU [Lachnospira multipara]|jgi:nitrogen fixation NifU-like protein|uniref:Fe-S cluster assembly sulfur transfer protein SufU n=1 Tax=Lachnospira multipara TaxID=28051 RepID=UPI0004E117BE|nr:SUF system NifU family Fe-S cluster assembly protein [Lachnospira multipara]
MENNRSFYNEILTEHNVNPYHKTDIKDANYELHGVNPSCGDEITLKLKVDNDKIVDAGYVGDGCAISQASADMMIDLVLGKTKEEALRLADIFFRMIKDEISEDELEELEEAGALQDISHMPARVKCAVLSWHTLEEMFECK